MNRSEKALQRLKGPVVPLNICFDDDRTINFEATGQYVDWLCTQHVPVVMLTYGSSEFAWLTEQDIFELTTCVGEAIGGRSLFIASTGFWPVRKSREFLQHAAASGADAVKVQINMWDALTGSLLQGYFDQLGSSAELPLVLWYNPGPSRAVLASDTLAAICQLAKRPDIIGIKNDGNPFYDYYDMIRGTAGEAFAVISGGLMRNFLFGYPLGSPAYLCPIAPFRPDIAREFHQHLVEGRTEAAREIMIRCEDPLMELAGSVNWLLLMKTAIRMLGFYPNNNLAAPRRDGFPKDDIARIEVLLKKTFQLDRAAK